MAAFGLSGLTPGAAAAAWTMIGVVAFAAVKIGWGMALWTMKGRHRIGDRWGDEPVEVVEWRKGWGLVDAGGELWQATSKETLEPGDRVRVVKTKGLTLDVRRS